jgi:hypothetical protein
MRALISNANLMSERATNNQIVLIGSQPYEIIDNGEIEELQYNAEPNLIKNEVSNLHHKMDFFEA